MNDSTWAEMQRYRDLAKEMGGDADALQLAVEALQTYQTALREARLARDEFRRRLLRYEAY